MKDVLVIIDAGHGQNTPGKRSPLFEDGRQLFEWKYSRELAKRLIERFQPEGIRTVMVVPEDTDITLSNRATRINNFVAEEKRYGRSAIMVSIHGNAAGSGKWTNAQGWEVWSTEKKNNSDVLAQCFIKNFNTVFPDKKNRGHKEKNFTIIYKSNCPAVLTENFFYDNKEECEWMLTDDCLDRVVELHYRAIKEYIASL